jgi:uncharacterized protein (DUF2235 family)
MARLERSKKQLVFYQPGVGTFGLIGWWRQLRSNIRIIMGLATGAGISDNVMEAYQFLVENWEFGDRIYVLGFSRGAYTARLLTGFIRIFGLVRREQLHLLRFAWRAYTRLGQPGSKDFSAEIGHFQKVLGGHGVRIEFLGLWDTVASVFDSRSGFPWLTITQKAYTNQNNRVKIVRHAVAIDEQRTYFQPSLWEPGQDYEEWSRRKKGFVKTPQDFEEVWFTGCHGDVGGGYPDAKSGLAKIPLEWLYREAEAAGIIGDEKVFDLLAPWNKDRRQRRAKPGSGPRRSDQAHQGLRAPDPLADANQSMRGGWPIAEFLPRKIPATAFRIRFRLGKFYIPLFDHRRIPEGAKLHEAVIERLEKRPGLQDRRTCPRLMKW